MNKFRASYSILSTWASGDTDRAIRMYFKLDDFDTPQMRAGRDFHTAWDMEVSETKCMPSVFGARKLNNPITERKIVKQIEPWLELVGVIDLQDGELLVDYKTGKTRSSAYANGFQHCLYQILVPEAKRFEYHHWDQYRKKADMQIIHLNKESMLQGMDYLIAHASDMHSYLEENNLYEKLKKEK